MKIGELSANMPEVAAKLEPCPACYGTGKRGTLELGAVLRAIRVESGLSLSRVARELDISKSMCSELERGLKHHPSVVFCEAWITVCRRGART